MTWWKIWFASSSVNLNLIHVLLLPFKNVVEQFTFLHVLGDEKQALFRLYDFVQLNERRMKNFGQNIDLSMDPFKILCCEFQFFQYFDCHLLTSWNVEA